MKKSYNTWSKTRSQENPYCTVEANGWTWKILKAYQERRLELKNKFARVFCAVQSPMTRGGFDLGDAYLADIPKTGNFNRAFLERLVTEAELRAEDEATGSTK